MWPATAVSMSCVGIVKGDVGVSLCCDSGVCGQMSVTVNVSMCWRSEG